MLRRFLIAVLLFFVVLLVAADRIGAIVGAHVLATKLKADERLSSTPSTSIHGFPFLTQAIGGKYHDVTITANNVPVDGDVTVTTLTATLHGVHLPLSKIIGGSVSVVPVDRVTGTAFVSYAAANNYLRAHGPTGDLITLSPGLGDVVRVVEQVRLRGQSFSLRANGSATVTDGDNVIVTLSKIRATGSQKSVGAQLIARLPSKLVSVTVPLRGLPFRFDLTSVTASATGLSASGTATHVVLGSPTD
jgi:LmeA-like phospholipid-binding